MGCGMEGGQILMRKMQYKVSEKVEADGIQPEEVGLAYAKENNLQFLIILNNTLMWSDSHGQKYR